LLPDLRRQQFISRLILRVVLIALHMSSRPAGEPARPQLGIFEFGSFAKVSGPDGRIDGHCVGSNILGNGKDVFCVILDILVFGEDGIDCMMAREPLALKTTARTGFLGKINKIT